VAKELASEYGLRATWQGNVVHFERTSLQGRLQLESGEIVVEVTLGFFLAPFRDSIARAIETKLDVVLAEHRPTTASKSGAKKSKRKKASPR
jgi:putative polyhydroxyalkanoate system protein